MMEQQDIIIIGAGISGLSLAHYCIQSGLKVLVIEKNNRVGGCLHSHRFSGEADDFWLELGAHTCYNSYGNLLGIMQDCRMLDRISKRENLPFRFVIDDRIKSIQSQINFMELFLSAPRLFTAGGKNGQSVEGFYSRIVGRRNFEKVFTHVFDAVISQEADDFPADMLFKKRRRRKDIIKKFTMTGGLQYITDSLAAQPGMRIATGTAVRSIDFGDGLYNVQTTEGASYLSQGIGLAVPAQVAAGLLQAGFPDLSEQLAKIEVNNVETVGVAIPKDAISIKPVAGLIAIGDSFYSAVSRDVVPDDNFRGFSFHFKAGALDHDAKILRIGKVLGTTPDKIRHSVDKMNIVPRLRVGQDQLVDKIDRLISGSNVLLTGNYFSGMAIEDCVTRSRKEFSRIVTGPGRTIRVKNAG